MDDYPLVEIEDMNADLIEGDSYLKDLTVADINGPGKHGTASQVPMRVNALILLLVFEGTCELNIDYVHYKLEANTFATIMPTHVVQFLTISPTLRGRLLVASRSFLEQTAPARRSPNVHYMNVRKNPCVRLKREEIMILDDCMQQIREKIRKRTHLLQRDMLQNALVGFFIEIANIMMQQGGRIAPPTLSRKEELLDKFLQLLFEHVKEEHGVAFYAEKLLITPQYLSLVLKEQTGKAANKWIDEVLVSEAKILLKSPQITVQKVADLLHFSDQSTFGKFFKKQTGLSIEPNGDFQTKKHGKNRTYARLFGNVCFPVFVSGRHADSFPGLCGCLPAFLFFSRFQDAHCFPAFQAVSVLPETCSEDFPQSFFLFCRNIFRFSLDKRRRRR